MYQSQKLEDNEARLSKLQEIISIFCPQPQNPLNVREEERGYGRFPKIYLRKKLVRKLLQDVVYEMGGGGSGEAQKRRNGIRKIKALTETFHQEE